MQNLDQLYHQIRAAHACARLRHPGATWVTTQLLAKDDDYISQIVLTEGERPIVVYVDVNRYVKQVLSEVKN